MKFNHKMIVEYDGTNFNGWQIQPGKRTVQGTLQSAISTYTREKISVLGAGRTDAGVHAIWQVCAFKLSKSHRPADLRFRLNQILPADVKIIKALHADATFDPRRGATTRTYKYYIAEKPAPLMRHFRYQPGQSLEIRILNRAAALLQGEHDFTAFCRRKSLKVDNRCRVYLSRWFRYQGALIYQVTANRFLHHMVRRMVGGMLAVARSKISLTQFKRYLNNKDEVRFSVPAAGLILTRVTYGKEPQ